jgi:hypothetical protein
MEYLEGKINKIQTNTGRILETGTDPKMHLEPF